MTKKSCWPYIQSKVFTKFHVRAIDTIEGCHSIVLLIVLESKINKRLVFLVLPSGVGYLRESRSLVNIVGSRSRGGGEGNGGMTSVLLQISTNSSIFSQCLSALL